MAAKVRLLGIFALSLLLVLGASAPASQIDGTLVMVDPDDYLFTVSDDLGGPHNFQLRVDGQVFINGARATMWDLRPDDRVRVEYLPGSGEGLVATMIRCNRK